MIGNKKIVVTDGNTRYFLRQYLFFLTINIIILSFCSGCNGSSCQNSVKRTAQLYGKGIIVGKFRDIKNRHIPNFVLDNGDTLVLTYYLKAYEFAEIGDKVFKDSNMLEMIVENNDKYYFYPNCGDREYRNFK